MRELTAMQAAYWAGRASSGPLGGVAAHLYAEFDGNELVPDRLRCALDRLGSVHPMIRLAVDADGRQSIREGREMPVLETEDLRALPGTSLHRHLAAKRRAWAEQALDLIEGQATAFSLSLLPGGRARLHVDVDMIAIDPVSFRVMMDDLAALYLEPQSNRTGDTRFFDWLDSMSVEVEHIRQRERDRLWWQEKLAALPPAPLLPLRPDGRARRKNRRLATRLSCAQRHALENAARALRVTPTTLLLGLFAIALGRATQCDRFRLNLPIFWRAPAVGNEDQLVGEFSNLLIVAINLHTVDTAGALCQGLQTQIFELLAHSAYPGVNVMRDLSRRRGDLEVSPVVFSSGLGSTVGELFSERVRRVFGKLNWVTSQGSQVALDVQVAVVDGGLLINWDVRIDAVARDWVIDLFSSYSRLLRKVSDQPDLLSASLSRLNDEVQPSRRSDEHVSRSPSETEKMVIHLMNRLCGDRAVPETDADMVTIMAENELADFRNFINRYITSCALSRDDLRTHNTPRRIADLMRLRTNEVSEMIAGAFLKSVCSDARTGDAKLQDQGRDHDE
ncbi:condensation domain-containing protein [Rhodomicrobium lacus]|uniref:condensation domain-containing protein n=1 Tax=Rhodomicrobium lacus TaxID=2498452 RepID=UPI000F8C936D|nr:condensation domain-containing protein [Rhodomicrobium lacus]